MRKSIRDIVKGVCIIVAVLVSVLLIGILFGLGTYIAGNDASLPKDLRSCKSDVSNDDAITKQHHSPECTGVEPVGDTYKSGIDESGRIPRNLLRGGCQRTTDVVIDTVPTIAPVCTPLATSDPPPKIKPVDILLADIIKNNVANKSEYNVIGGSKDVHICGNMACEQAEWIADKYGYETGMVLLWNSGQDASHAQTWVMIDNERYIFESTTYDAYWNESDHKDRFGGSNAIRFVPTKKGREHAKAASEWYRSG